MGLIPDIRRPELRLTLVAFATLFSILAAHMLMQTVRDALFLTHLPPTELPFVYLGIAGLALVISMVQSRTQRAGMCVKGLGALLLASAIVTVGFWALVAFAGPWALYGLYVWSGVFGLLAAVQFWLGVGRIFTLTQAKRLFAFIGAGGVVGAIGGASLAAWLTSVLEPAHALLVGAGIMAVSGLLVLRFFELPDNVTPDAPANRAAARVRDSLSSALSHPYVARLAALVVVSTIALTLANYWFANQVAALVEPEALGPFLGVTYACMGALALIAQFTLTGVLLRTVGAPAMLFAAPAVLLGGSVGAAVGGGLIAAVAIKGADEVLRHTVDRTATEVVYVPIPQHLRERAKTFVDTVGKRGAVAVGSLLILGLEALGGAGPGVAWALVAMSVAWVALVARFKRHHLDLFRESLRSGTLDAARADLRLDMSALEALFSALNSRNDQEVLTALDILAQNGKGKLIPTMILYHPSESVVLRALDLFTGQRRRDLVPIADRLLEIGAPRIRAAALRARASVEPDPDVLSRARRDPDPLVSSTALIGLAVAGTLPADEIGALLDELCAQADAETKVALAEAVGSWPNPAFDRALMTLATEPVTEVRAAAARAMAVRRDESFLPALVPLIADRATRPAARQAMLAIGGESLTFLERLLANHDLPVRIRVHLPRTISAFDAAPAADILLRHLPTEPHGMVHYKILRGLARLVRLNPGLALDHDALQRATEAHLSLVHRLLETRMQLAEHARAEASLRTEAHGLLVEVLRGKEQQAIERLFRLQGLMYPQESFRRIYRGVRSGDPKLLASALELVEGVVEAPTRDALVALVGHTDDARRLAGLGHSSASEPVTYAALLRRFADDDSLAIREIARYHAAEVGVAVAARPRPDAAPDEVRPPLHERMSWLLPSLRPPPTEVMG